MQYLGIVALILAIYGIANLGKVKKLARRVKSLEKKHDGKEKGEISRMFEGLVGKTCKISVCDDFASVKTYQILEADDEWLKVSSTNKKGVTKTEMIRVDRIDSVEIL